jgi:hypothetical protein
LVETGGVEQELIESNRVAQIAGFWPTSPHRPLRLDHVEIERISTAAIISLVAVLAKNWVHYDSKRTFVAYGKRSRQPVAETVDELWWELVHKQAAMPCEADGVSAPLCEVWLPDDGLQPELRRLLPVLSAKAFGAEWPTVREWLAGGGWVRRDLSALSSAEWRKILSENMPTQFPATGGVESCRAAGRVYETALMALKRANPSAAAELCGPVLARRGNDYAYVDSRNVGLLDDQAVADAFAGEVWTVAWPNDSHDAAVRLFGFWRCSEGDRVQGWMDDAGMPDAELTARIKRTVPFVFASRCSQASNRREKFLQVLRETVAVRVDELVERVRLRAVDGERAVRRRWALRGRKILLPAGGDDVVALGGALGELLDRPSDSALYQNLLRCENDAERIEVLVAQGLARDLIEGLRVEFQAMAKDIPATVDTEAGSAVADSQHLDPSPATSANGPAVQSAREDAAEFLSNPPLRGALKSPGDGDHWTCVEGGARADGASPSVPARRYQLGDANPGGGGVESSKEDKLEVEASGREFCEAELKRLGYAVKQMPQQNPGFDIEAERGGDLLLIEVKAHRTTAAVVDLTEREWQTYLESLQTGATFRWELWNVENVGAVAVTVITRYTRLPKDSLRNATYRVDLSRCSGSAGASAGESTQ